MLSEWCNDQIPLPYSYVQDHYWKVGLFRYFELKQVPNFILATPILYLLATHCGRFLNYHKYYSLRLGCTYFSIDPAQKVPPHDVYATKILPHNAFVYIVHALAMSAFAFLCVHVQISTRLLCSSSPVLYWIAAVVTTPPDRKPCPANLDFAKEELATKIETKENLENNFRNVLTEEPIVSDEARWIKLYFVSYAIIGTIMFSNFLPWT